MSMGKILIVEDEKVLREVYEIILSTAGYEIKTAVNGQDALDALKDWQPTLIILDILMPIMDGREFMQQLATTPHSALKVVVFSNTSDSVVRTDMFKLGADQVVLKADMVPKDLIALVAPYFADQQ